MIRGDTNSADTTGYCARQSMAPPSRYWPRRRDTLRVLVLISLIALGCGGSAAFSGIAEAASPYTLAGGNAGDIPLHGITFNGVTSGTCDPNGESVVSASSQFPNQAFWNPVAPSHILGGSDLSLSLTETIGPQTIPYSGFVPEDSMIGPIKSLTGSFQIRDGDQVTVDATLWLDPLAPIDIPSTTSPRNWSTCYMPGTLVWLKTDWLRYSAQLLTLDGGWVTETGSAKLEVGGGWSWIIYGFSPDSSDPDLNGNGIFDAIEVADTEPPTFSDGSPPAVGSGTWGTIVSTGGLDVVITDASPGGVTVTTTGTGGPLVLHMCNGGYDVTIGSGSSIGLTCGSITVEAAAGSQPVSVTVGAVRFVVTPTAETAAAATLSD
ncbi:MAG: hypothetical protein OEW29_09150, partial [Acidimicrobiia bacterium]|nr:hypothetical protein [Acidimicrobiia bacterium]